MPKICQKENCNYPIFGGGFCKYHQYMRAKKANKGKISPVVALSPLRRGKIPSASKKRLEGLKLYKKASDEVLAEQKTCFFCGDPMKVRGEIHHLKGRRGKLLYDKDWLVRVHQGCHMKHKFMPIEKLILQKWWDGYLDRLKKLDVELWEKEQRRIGKSD